MDGEAIPTAITSHVIMMAPTKLSEIKTEIRRAFADEYDDPIAWLKERHRQRKRKPMSKAAAEKALESQLRQLESVISKERPKKRAATPESTEVFESLMRLFEKAKPKKRRKRKVAKTAR